MKKALFVTVILALFLCSTNFAMALDYDQSTNKIATDLLDTIKTTNSWSLANQKRYFESATLTMTASSLTTGLLGGYTIGVLNIGTGTSFNLFNGVLDFSHNSNGTLTATLALTGNALASLNDYIRTNPALLNFTLTTYGGAPTLSSVRLQGVLGNSVAPEPISMALVAAGLVGLPFARRLRKAVTKEV